MSIRLDKRSFVVGLALFALGTMGGAFAQNQPQQPPIQFLFAFGAQEVAEGKTQPTSVKNDMVLSSGDRLKVFIEPKSDTYAYFLNLGSQGDLTLLFPPPGGSAKISPEDQVYIPEGLKWFELDHHPGQEKFYLLISAQRLERLEALLARHIALKEKKDMQTSNESILAEIKELRQKNKNLSAPAEKPVRIGGSVRGQQFKAGSVVPDITPLAIEITAPGFYSRTFTIDHR
jgi:hypothetical protein